MAKVRLNSDPAVVKKIREGLRQRGGYCPCRAENKPEYKCMCEEFKAQIEDPAFEGYCHCKLYYKEMEKMIMQKIWNFELISESYIRETDAVLYEYQHAITGTRLLYLSTENQNKFFSVTFKTIPEDHTGVFHILEHSVFCGSEKFPVKDPFLEMEKGSVNTFLNAMTFPDRTVYPVSSRNEKDFQNLVKIYLDAVFRPNIYKNEYVFMQEGWHYEFDEEQVCLNGVVLNEMKGVEASVDSRIHQSLMELIFPDTCYQYASGGKSEDIPKLTYAEYLKAHKKYYSPQNAIFYLEGKIDIRKTISLIEEYVLEPNDAAEEISEIPYQKPVLSQTQSMEYPIMEEENSEDQWFYAFGKTLNVSEISEDEQMIKSYAGKILSEYLTGSLDSPLQQGILMNGLGQGVEMVIDTSLKQPYLFLKVSNSKEESLPAIRILLESLPSMIVENPFFREQLDAVITNLEFRSHEQEEPIALEHMMLVMDNYLYGRKPSGYLETASLYQNLRNLLETDYYEKLLYELLDVDALSLVIAKPSSDKAAEEKQMEASYIYSAFKLLDEVSRQNWKQKNKGFQKWLQTPDSAEAKERIPKLSLTDLDSVPEKRPREIQEYRGVRTILCPASLEDMAYLNLYFPVPVKYQNSLCQLSLLNNLLTNLPTEKYDSMMLYQMIQEMTGYLHFEFLSSENISWTEEQKDTCKVYLVLKTSFSKRNTSKVMGLIEEILYHTLFDNAETTQNILLQIQDMFHHEIMENGSSMGVRKSLSSWSAIGLADECLEGTSCMDFLKGLLESYETESKSFLQYTKKAVNDIFTRDKMIVGLTYPKKDRAEDYGYREIIESIPDKETKDIYMKLSYRKEDDVIPIPADTGFATAAIRLEHVSAQKIGAWKVACHILSTDYLWPKIRAQGGAYGTDLQVGISGDVFFYTYRDPDGKNSLEILRGCAEYLELFADSETSLEPYIISTIAKMDPLLSVKECSDRELQYEINQISHEKKCEIYQKILHVTRENLRSVADEMKVLFNQMTTCLIIGKC